MRRKSLEFDVIIEQDENKSYVARVPALPGCHTEGDTQEEAMANIREAIGIYLEHVGSQIQHPMKFVSVKKVSLPSAV
ncbi:type II toxin-antitoxin system HicB family antitoxin [Candidatus Micrarchaeota archaeon]|nr:type II toxin-antitoxin system HicB family antitoxin [Candidatus Micrarchaeota archaeon]